MKKPKPFVPVVAVLNMKGGVGKTTISANVALALFENHVVHTLLLDLDPQFNLTQGLFTRDGYDEYKAQGKTIYAAMEPPSDVSLFEIAVSNQPPPDVEDIRHNFFHIIESPSVELDIVPGDFQLVKYSLMDDNAKLGAVKERFLKFVRKAKNRYKLVVIDCNPSSSFLTLCALHAASHVLVPVRPDRFSMLGLEILSEFIDNLPTLRPKPQLLILLNGVKRGGKDKVATSVEAELRAHPKFSPRTLANILPETAVLKARTDYTGFSTDRRSAWQAKVKSEVAQVAVELAKKLGL